LYGRPHEEGSRSGLGYSDYGPESPGSSANQSGSGEEEIGGLWEHPLTGDVDFSVEEPDREEPRSTADFEDDSAPVCGFGEGCSIDALI
jgi:hypothetical protein